MNTESIIHPHSDVQSKNIGAGTRIWQYCVILPGAKVGGNCNINANTFIENDVIVGDSVTIKCGVQLWDGARIGSNVFIGPNVTFTNDRYPRSKQYPGKFLSTIIEDWASIGANATILPGVRIGRNSIIGAGAVVTRNVPPNAIVVGNPATITGYVDASDGQQSRPSPTETLSAENCLDLGVGDCKLYGLPLIPDLRGNLSVAEHQKHVPFVAERLFWVFDVPTREVRGEHAHKACHQYLIAVKGSVNVVLDDGKARKEVILDRPNSGLHISPGVWGIQYKYSPDAVLLVLASDKYDPSDYIRNYEEFLQYKLQTKD